MKKRFVVLTLLIVIVSCFSCSEKSKESYSIVKSFPVETELTNGRVLTQFNDELEAVVLFKAGNYIISYKMGAESFCSVYDRDYNKLGEILRNGRGPGEYLSPFYNGQYEVENGETKIWVSNLDRKNMEKINVDKTLKNGLPEVEEIIDLSEIKDAGPIYTYYVNENMLAGLCIDRSQEFSIFGYDVAANEITVLDNFWEIPEENRMLLSTQIARIKPDKSKLMSFYARSPHIDLYDIDAAANKIERSHTVFYGQKISPELAVEDGMMNFYYMLMHTTDDHIYMMMSNSNPLNESDNYFIHVYDWDGVPVASMKCGKCTSFYIDEDARLVYLLDRDSEDGFVTVYDMPEF